MQRTQTECVEDVDGTRRRISRQSHSFCWRYPHYTWWWWIDSHRQQHRHQRAVVVFGCPCNPQKPGLCTGRANEGDVAGSAGGCRTDCAGSKRHYEAIRRKQVRLAYPRTPLRSSYTLFNILPLPYHLLLYSVARAILLRPVQQEIDTVHKKLECIIASCVDPGQPRRDLEQLLHSIVSSITSELAQ